MTPIAFSVRAAVPNSSYSALISFDVLEPLDPRMSLAGLGDIPLLILILLRHLYLRDAGMYPVLSLPSADLPHQCPHPLASWAHALILGVRAAS